VSKSESENENVSFLIVEHNILGAVLRQGKYCVTLKDTHYIVLHVNIQGELKRKMQTRPKQKTKMFYKTLATRSSMASCVH